MVEVEYKRSKMSFLLAGSEKGHSIPPGTISVKFSSFLGQLQYEIFYNIIFYVNQEFTDIQMKFNRHSIPIQLTFID